MNSESFNPNSLARPAIIAMKGLPCTGKWRVAKEIAYWAKCPVLYIDDFIGDDDHHPDVGWEEAERLQVSVLQKAFTTLLRVAKSQLSTPLKLVVIKSRLCSTFELQQLMQLVDNLQCILLIVECQMRNKHQWQKRFNNLMVPMRNSYEKKWYRPRRWNDIEKARDDLFDPQALADWDLSLLHSIKSYRKTDLFRFSRPPPLVRRLVVDPYNDIDLQGDEGELNPILAHSINHLLTARQRKLDYQNPYVAEFDEFRLSRAEEILNALTSSTRSKDICGAEGCLFKYREELRGIEVEGNCCCEVCEEKVVSGQPGYTCHYCILTLHKSCAEMIHFDFRNICTDFSSLLSYIYKSPGEKHACNACKGKGLAFRSNCDSCCFQTLLKGRLLPPVVNHDRHPHPLSVRIEPRSFACKACGTGITFFDSSYVCKICEWYYHIQCVFMPREWEHGHGGHEHVLKLKYSQDDMEQEDYWCDVCFQDLDPYFWFSSCQSCPYYAAHLCCAGVYPHRIWPHLRIR